MKHILALIAVLSVSTAAASDKSCHLGPIRVAVVDTGFGYPVQGYSTNLCKDGHKDFSKDQAYTKNNIDGILVPTDLNGHGTNVAGLIENYANKGKNKFCLIIVKFYSAQHTNLQNSKASSEALQYVNTLDVDVVNYSGGGEGDDEKERLAVKKILDNKKIFVAAAGNEGKLIDGKEYSYYPASYDPRVTVVGNGKLGHREKSSNYGSIVDVWENGVNQIAYGLDRTGTSQSAAIHTGKVIAGMKTCDKRK